MVMTMGKLYGVLRAEKRMLDDKNRHQKACTEGGLHQLVLGQYGKLGA